MTDKKPKRLSRRFTDSWTRFALEFTAILVGVLVAFSLNSWGDRQQEKRLERFYIQELIDNLATDEAHLGQVIETQQRGRTTLDTLLQIMPEAAPEDTPAIDSLFASSRGNRTFFPAVGAYRAMISEGALNLISNKSLVTVLVELYEHYYVRLSYLGTVLDDETQRISWERRKFYSSYTDEFYDVEAIRSREMYSMNEHRYAYIGLYLGHARNTDDKIAEVRAALEQELRRIE